jgi:predicted Zn-dependent protease
MADVRLGRLDLPRWIPITLLALLLVATPLARGSVDWRVQVAVAIVACLTLLLTASRSSSLMIPWVALGMVAAVVAMLIQIVPVSPAVHHLLSPSAQDLFMRTLAPLGLYPSFRPLSLDPAATGRELAKAAACVAACCSAALAARSKDGPRPILGALPVAGLLVGIVSIAGTFVGQATPFASTVPFRNSNHLAGFLGLAAWPALGLALERRAGWLFWASSFLLCSLALFLTLSRGGIAAFFVGAAVFATLQARGQRGPSVPRHLRMAAPAAVALVLALAAFVGFDRLRVELESVRQAPTEIKVEQWPVAAQFLAEFPIVGIGRGAFESAFPRLKLDPSPTTFTHIENELLQFPIDLGLPVGIGLLALFFWSVGRAVRRCTTAPEIGTLAGTVALSAQNLVDFSLEVLGVAIPFSIALGILVRSHGFRLGRIPTVAGATALLFVATGGLSLYTLHPTAADAEAVLAAPNEDVAVQRAIAALSWHPADYLPQAVAGIRLVQANRCPEGLPWLNRAMLANPTAPEPHRYAARCLAASGQRAAAAREYRLAFLLGERHALAEAIQRFSSLEERLAVTTDTPEGLRALGQLLSSSEPAMARQVLQLAWNEFQDLPSLGTLAEVTLSLGDPDEALTFAREIERRDPTQPLGYVVASAALERHGDREAALRELELGAARLPVDARVHYALAAALGARRRYPEERAALEAISPADQSEKAYVRTLVSRSYLEQGRYSEALADADAAIRLDPDNPRVYVAYADVAFESARYDDSARALARALAFPRRRWAPYEAQIQGLRTRLEARGGPRPPARGRPD